MAQQVRLGANVSTKREGRHTEICIQWPEQSLSDPGQNQGVHSSSSEIVRENNSATKKEQVLMSVTPGGSSHGAESGSQAGWLCCRTPLTCHTERAKAGWGPACAKGCRRGKGQQDRAGGFDWVMELLLKPCQNWGNGSVNKVLATQIELGLQNSSGK